MICYYCGHDSEVTNSRLQKRTGFIWRRRRCTACKAVWTTLESPDWPTLLAVTDKNGKTTPFQRDKLFLSLYESCKHRKTALTDATALTEVIMGKVGRKSKNGLLDKSVIIENTANTLKRFDKTAFTVYTAYHKI